MAKHQSKPQVYISDVAHWYTTCHWHRIQENNAYLLQIEVVIINGLEYLNGISLKTICNQIHLPML